jgi:hypothetical protein
MYDETNGTVTRLCRETEISSEELQMLFRRFLRGGTDGHRAAIGTPDREAWSFPAAEVPTIIPA